MSVSLPPVMTTKGLVDAVDASAAVRSSGLRRSSWHRCPRCCRRRARPGGWRRWPWGSGRQAALAGSAHHLLPAGQVILQVRPHAAGADDDAGKGDSAGAGQQGCVFALPVVGGAVVAQDHGVAGVERVSDPAFSAHHRRDRARDSKAQRRDGRGGRGCGLLWRDESRGWSPWPPIISVIWSVIWLEQ